MNTARRRKFAASFVLLAGMSGAILAGCSSEKGTEEPTTTTTTTTTSPSPTEKAIDPTGGNKFTPDVKAPGPQTAAPGNLPGNAPKN